MTSNPIAGEMLAVLAIGALVTVGWLAMVVRLTGRLRHSSPALAPERSKELLSALRAVARVVLVSGVITLLIAGAEVSLQFLGAEQNHRLRLNIETQRAAVAEAHVWLEEALEGDGQVSVAEDVWGNLELARRLCRESERSAAGEYDWLPLMTAARADIEQVCQGIDRLMGLARLRLSSPEEAGSGTAADVEFDRAYRAVTLAQFRVQEQLHRWATQYHQFSVAITGGLLALLFLLGVAAIGVTVTARRAIEHDLVDLQRLASIVQSSSDAIFSGSPEGIILNWNAGAERILGYSADEVVGESISILFPPERRAEVIAIREGVRDGEFADGLETSWMTREGQEVVVSLTTSPIRDAFGQVTSISVVARDVTRQKRAEEELRGSNERYRLVGKATQDIVWDLDLLHQTMLWGEGICSEFGYERDSIRPDADWWLERVHPEDRIQVFASILGALEGTGEDWSGEYRFRRADGRYASILSRAYILRDGAGTARRIIGSLTDTTERKRWEQELVRAKDEAERASRAKSEFLSRMSHELRTPMHSVLGFSLLLRQNAAENLAPEEVLYLDRLLANARHLLELINELLDLSRIEAGKMEVDLGPVALDQVVREVLEQLQGGVRDRPVELLAELPAGVAPITSDAVKVRQILVNLVGNAIKFTPEGHVRVALHVDPSTRQPLRIAVSDTGIGIPADRLGAIFEPFQQAEQDSARRYGGTGLGLSISKSLAGLLGYRIEVETEAGVGTTFHLLLTGEAEVPLEAHAAEAPPPAGKGAPEDEPFPDGEAAPLLIVGHDQDGRLRGSLAELDWFEVSVAATGEEGLRLAGELLPALITLSLPLPDMTGWNFLRALRSLPDLEEVPVMIGSTGEAEVPDIPGGILPIFEEPLVRETLRGRTARSHSPSSPGTGASTAADEADLALRGLLESEGAHA